MLIQELSLSQEALARPKGPNSFFWPPGWHGMLPSMQRGSKGRALMTPDFVGPLPSDHISHIPLSPDSWPLRRRKEDRLRNSVFYAGEPEHYLKELFKILDRTLNWIEHWLFSSRFFVLFFSAADGKHGKNSSATKWRSYKWSAHLNYYVTITMLTGIVNLQEWLCSISTFISTQNPIFFLQE